MPDVVFREDDWADTDLALMIAVGVARSLLKPTELRVYFDDPDCEWGFQIEHEIDWVMSIRFKRQEFLVSWTLWPEFEPGTDTPTEKAIREKTVYVNLNDADAIDQLATAVSPDGRPTE